MDIVTFILFVVTGMIAYTRDDEGEGVFLNMLSWAGAWIVGFWLFQAGPFG